MFKDKLKIALSEPRVAIKYISLVVKKQLLGLS